MNKNKRNIYHRHSIRLKGYDYSQEGLYFITIVTQNRKKLFGEIKQGKMILNEAGKITEECWLEIPNHFFNTQLHEYIIMPNHIHGIIEITVGANNHSPQYNHHFPNDANNHSPQRDKKIIPICWIQKDYWIKR